MKQDKYDVFISYSRADYTDKKNNVIPNSAVDIILKTLEQNVISYWIDIDGDNASNQYMAKITKAIDNSNMVLFISSRKSNDKDSYWPIKEVTLAGEKHKRVLPIQIDDSNYNDNIALILAGTDAIEYYKNDEAALKKLVNSITGENVEISQPIKSKFRKAASLISFFLLAIIAAFLVFASIGFCVGYFGTREKVDILFNETIASNKISIVDSTTIRYVGNNISFSYDIEKDDLLPENGERDILDNISIEKIVMSVSIPFMFERLFKYAENCGNGKTKFAILVGGSIGILCGYSVGEYIGEQHARMRNDEDIRNYLREEQTRRSILNYMKIYYNIND